MSQSFKRFGLIAKNLISKSLKKTMIEIINAIILALNRANRVILTFVSLKKTKKMIKKRTNPPGRIISSESCPAIIKPLPLETLSRIVDTPQVIVMPNDKYCMFTGKIFSFFPEYRINAISTRMVKNENTIIANIDSCDKLLLSLTTEKFEDSLKVKVGIPAVEILYNKVIIAMICT